MDQWDPARDNELRFSLDGDISPDPNDVTAKVGKMNRLQWMNYCVRPKVNKLFNPSEISEISINTYGPYHMVLRNQDLLLDQLKIKGHREKFGLKWLFTGFSQWTDRLREFTDGPFRKDTSRRSGFKR